MITRTLLFGVAAAGMIAGCERVPRGKDYLTSHPEELRELIKACADGSHPNEQECSNAESLRTLDNKMRSLSK